jgi:hypothetical protein
MIQIAVIVFFAFVIAILGFIQERFVARGHHAWRFICADSATSGLTPRWSQRRLRLEFMDGLGYTTIIEPAEPLARRRGSTFVVRPHPASCQKLNIQCGQRDATFSIGWWSFA